MFFVKLVWLFYLIKISINIVVLVFIFSFFRTGNYIFFRLFLMRISDIPYLDLAGDDGMSRKKIQHSWNLHLYILISFDMYIVRLLPLFFSSSVQFFRAGIMYFMSHFQRNGKHQIFISSSLPLVSLLYLQSSFSFKSFWVGFF